MTSALADCNHSSVELLSWNTLLIRSLLRRTAIADVELAVALRVCQASDRRRGGEVGVSKRFIGRNALRWVELEQLVKQIDCERVCFGEHVLEGHSGNSRESSHLDFGRVVNESLHCIVVWRAEDAQNLVELVIVVTSTEEWQPRDHLSHDAACAPNVDRGRISTRS